MLSRTLAAVAAAAFCSLASPAHAVGALVDVQLIDRASGETLPMYWHNGRWWAPGRPGNRYGVMLTNRSFSRTLSVMAVDGVNVVSGQSAAHDQTGYVLLNGQNATISGWRTDLSRVAAFEFTAVPNSYAARTGRPDNVGVIGVAVFREKPRLPAPPPTSRAEDARDAAAAAPSAKSESAAGAGRSDNRLDEADRRQRAPAPEQRLGTGYGRSEHSPTRLTEFERAQTTPDEVITIHYDSRENLVAMGAIPSPRHALNPFPATAGFVPPPPR